MAGTIHLPGAAEGVGLYLITQQPPRWVFRSAALRGGLGFVLVVGLIVFDDIVLAAE